MTSSWLSSWVPTTRTRAAWRGHPRAVARINAQGVRASVSIGHACCGKNGDVDRTRRLADEAMYEAKRVNRRRHGRHPQPPGERDLVIRGH